MRVFIVLNSLTNNLSGVELSALNRLKMFVSYSSFDISLLTVNFHKNTVDFFEYYSLNYLGKSKDRYFDNIYMSILGRNKKCIERAAASVSAKYNYSERISEIHERYYDDQKKLLMYAVFYPNGLHKNKLNYINYFCEGYKIQRAHYTLSGSLSHIQYLEKDTGEVYREELLCVEGKPKIINYFSNKKLVRIEINNDDGLLEHVFYSKNELMKWWFEENLKNKDVLIFDGCSNWLSVFKGIDKKLKLISVLHSNHLAEGEPSETGRFISQQRYNLLTDDSFLDAHIILTKKQLVDISRRLKKHTPLLNIPHSLLDSVNRVSFCRRQLNRIIIAARLAPEKNLTDAIYIMRKVVDQLPDLELHIYGEGPEKEALTKLIDSLNLSENVALKGFTHDVKEKLNSACLYLSTSTRESFSLSILESLSCGVPVLAYNVDYGPSELIKHGYNGYLVNAFDIEDAASQILTYFSSENNMKNMSINSYLSVERYFPKNVVEKWRQLILD